MRYIQQRLGCSVIGFLLLTGFFYRLNLGYFGDIYLDSIQPIEIFNNKTSGTYENITIDNLPGSWNNWTWAVTQPWCSGLGTLETPYLIEGHTLSIDENFDGIHISNSQGINFKIKDCIFIWDGVIPAGTGISLINTTNGDIFNNTIYDISVGIEINGCENLIIRNNTIYNTMEGLSLFQSHFNELFENIIHNNVYGIRLEGSNNNSIYLNFFLKNGIHSIDDGSDNNWNSTIIGNYWDNHTSPDNTPQNGIVDSPYIYIEGSSGSIDFLPIAEDGAPRITIILPLPGARLGETAPSFHIIVNDDYLFEIWYSLDGGMHNYTIIQNGTISQLAWNALPEGEIVITFYAMDIAGNIAFKQVSIFKGGINPVIIGIIVTVISFLSILAVGYLYFKKREIR